MRWRRQLLAVGILVLLAGALAQGWVNSHTTDLVVVNASGQPVEISWQPTPFAAAVVQIAGGCESHSMALARGASWSVDRDGATVLDSAGANVSLFSPLVAVEVWLNPDGSVRIVTPHDVDRVVDAPLPDCQNAS